MSFNDDVNRFAEQIHELLCVNVNFNDPKSYANLSFITEINRDFENLNKLVFAIKHVPKNIKKCFCLIPEFRKIYDEKKIDVLTATNKNYSLKKILEIFELPVCAQLYEDIIAEAVNLDQSSAKSCNVKQYISFVELVQSKANKARNCS